MQFSAFHVLLIAIADLVLHAVLIASIFGSLLYFFRFLTKDEDDASYIDKKFWTAVLICFAVAFVFLLIVGFLGSLTF